MECTLPHGGKGFKWGNSGKCYADRKDAEKQAEAAYANGYKGDSLAVDSNRTIDVDGRLHIARTRISKACVNPYYGYEIPGYESLGLDPEKIYKLLRAPEELAKSASTFERLQILSKHVAVNADNIQNDVIAGSIGSNVEFVEPYLWADVCIWDAEDIAGIESNKKREFSCSYHYVPVMVKGNFQGTEYDGIMTDIVGNHLALVEEGRAGHDVLAADSKPKREKIKMRMTKLGKGLFTALGAVAPKLANDAAFPALVGTLTKETIDKPALKAKLIAMDAELDPEEIDSVMDAMTDEEETEEEKKKKKEAKDKKAKDEKEEEEKKAADKKAKDKKAKDEENDELDKRSAEDKKAMDTKLDAFKLELREADLARRAVRPVVGEVACDSALEIYGMALDNLKVPHAEVKELSGKKALFQLATKEKSNTPTVAMDATATAKKFPGLDRIKLA